MSIHNAIRFLRHLDQLQELRSALYGCTSTEAQLAKLRAEGYGFSGAEFEEAVDHMHCDCQTHSEADELMNRANWLRMVFANP
jgi:hypothetical protein